MAYCIDPEQRLLRDPTGGIATAIIVGSLLVSGATAGTTLATRPDKPKSPRKPKPPTQTASRAEDAAKRRQRQASAAFGRSDTIINSPLGLPGGGGGSTLGE